MGIGPYHKRWSFPAYGRSVVVVLAGVDPGEDVVERLPDVFISTYLEEWLEVRPDILREIDEALGGRAPQGLSTLAVRGHETQLLGRLNEAFIHGRLLAFTREPRAGHTAPREQRLSVVDSPSTPETRESWISVELVGEDDKPIAGIRYRVLLPDGTVSEGRLDGNGSVMVRSRTPGLCKVSFPDLDGGAWEPIASVG